MAARLDQDSGQEALLEGRRVFGTLI